MVYKNQIVLGSDQTPVKNVPIRPITVMILLVLIMFSIVFWLKGWLVAVIQEDYSTEIIFLDYWMTVGVKKLMLIGNSAKRKIMFSNIYLIFRVQGIGLNTIQIVNRQIEL